MGEERGVEVDAHIPLLGERHPLGEMLWLNPVPVNELAGLEDGIAGVEVQLLLTGHQTQCLVHVLHQLLRGLGLSGVVSSGLDASGQRAVMVEADDIVSLPTVERHGGLHALLDGCLHVHAVGGVNLFCGLKSFLCCHILCLPFLMNAFLHECFSSFISCISSV